MDGPLPEAVTVRFRWTVAEMTEGTRWHLRQARSRRVRAVIYGLAAVLVVASVVANHGRAGYERQRWIGVGVAVYLVLLLSLRHWLTLWQSRRNYRKSAACDSEIEWRISPAGLQVRHAHGSSEIDWGAYIRAVRTPQGLLLYPQPIIFHWLPRSGFASEADFEATAELARGKVAEFRRLG